MAEGHKYGEIARGQRGKGPRQGNMGKGPEARVKRERTHEIRG